MAHSTSLALDPTLPSSPGSARGSVSPPAAARRHAFKPIGRWLLPVLPWLGLLALWTAIRHSGLLAPALVPSVGDVVAQLGSHAADGRLWDNLAASTLRVASGVGIGVALAVPAGFALGWYAPLRRAFGPLINFFRALPPIALIPLMIIYLGIGEGAKITVLAYAAFFTGVVVLHEGIAQIQPIYIQVARTLGATDRELFFRVVLPLALPHLLTALRVALGVSWATLVAAELIAAQSGLGAQIQVAASYFQLDIIYLGIISIGLAALGMDTLLRRLSRRLLRWQERIA